MQNFDKMDHMHFIRKLPIPQELKKEMPLTPELAAYKDKRDQEIAAIIRSESDKLLLVIGPCSADREDAVIDYIHRLAEVQKQVADKILIVPRIYTGKPRTTGAGYKGMLHQPDPGKKPDMYEGIRAIRHIHLRALQETGLSCADEMLYPENHRYLSDLLGYVAVGARSVENQEHRLISSGLDIPVGMKNPMSGDLSVMINAIKAAHGDHSFIYRGWEVESQGNPLSHAILRGSVDRHGINHANYHYENLRILHNLYVESGIANPAVLIDTNHSNSSKQYLQQVRIANEVLHSMRHSADIRRLVKGFMIESYIEDGAQKWEDGIYGKSITDPCLGWDKTRDLIFSLADQL